MTDVSLVMPKLPSTIKWYFGKMPAAWENLHRPENLDVKFGVVGFGNVVDLFFRPSFAHFGSAIYVCDPYLPKSIFEQKIAALTGAGVNATIVNSLDEMPRNVDVALNLVRPDQHYVTAKQLMDAGFMTATEKPICLPSEMNDYRKLVATSKVPHHSLDWIFAQSQPLLAVAGERVPFPEFVHTEGSFDAFDWDNIVSISAHNVEGGGNVLGSDSTKIGARQNMGDVRKNGGLIWDMLSHQMTLLSYMGFETKGVANVVLGSETNTPGLYNWFGEVDGDNNRGEMYGSGELLLYKNGRLIRAIVECGKFGEFNHQSVTFTDKNGYTIHWQTVLNDDPIHVSNAAGSWAELRDPQGKVLGRAVQGADAYALIIHETALIAKGLMKPAPYFAAQINPTFAIAAMHALARSERIAPGTQVTQLPVNAPLRPFDPRRYTLIKDLVPHLMAA